MFFKKFKRALSVTLALCFAIMMLTLTTGATSRMRPSYSREAEMDNTTGGGTTEGASDSTGAGTGEFGDDTSNTGDAATDTTDDMRDTSNSDTSNKDDMSNIDSSPDGVIDRVDEGALEDVVDDTTDGGMGVWGVVIVIAIIAAIAVLVFAFFPRRK